MGRERHVGHVRHVGHERGLVHVLYVCVGACVLVCGVYRVFNPAQRAAAAVPSRCLLAFCMRRVLARLWWRDHEGLLYK